MRVEHRFCCRSVNAWASLAFSEGFEDFGTSLGSIRSWDISHSSNAQPLREKADLEMYSVSATQPRNTPCCSRGDEHWGVWYLDWACTGISERIRSSVALEVRATAEGDQRTGCIFPQTYWWISAGSSIGTG